MKKNYLLLQKAWNELINPCVNHTGSLRLDCRFRDYSCSAGKPGHEKYLHLIRTVKNGQKVPQAHTSLEHSALGNKSRMLKGIPQPLPPVGPLQAHLALVLCFYRMVN